MNLLEVVAETFVLVVNPVPPKPLLVGEALVASHPKLLIVDPVRLLVLLIAVSEPELGITQDPKVSA